MKKTDFDMFKLSLNVNIEVDNSIRKITEKVRLFNQLRNTKALSELSTKLSEVDTFLDSYILKNVVDHEQEE